jgi:diguanylate cyclase (GGDEF)-like protein
MRSLMDLVTVVTAARDYSELLVVMAEESRQALGAVTVSLSVWERDRGLVRTLVNAGNLRSDQERLPTDEVYRLADFPPAVQMFTEGAGYRVHRDDLAGDPSIKELLAREGRCCALAVPIHLDGRVWGELWATRDMGATPFSDDDLAFARLVAVQVGSGIAQAEHLVRVERLVFTDDLTGLANRRAFEDHLDIAFAQHRDSGIPVGLVVVDVNGLKQINDSLGHHAGDQALTTFAAELAAAASAVPGVLSARLGGDEFCLLAIGLDSERVAELAEDVCLRASQVLELGVACGVATTDAMHSVAMTPARLLRAADAAQYRAKRTRSAGPVVAGRRALEPDPPQDGGAGDRRAFRGRGTQSPSRLLDEILTRLDEVPDLTPDARLAEVGRALTRTVDGSGWFVSRVSDGRISTVAGELARSGDHEDAAPFFAVDDYPLDEYPASYAAASGHVVVADVDDPRSDSAEVALMMAGRIAELLMTGGPDSSGTAWLLEVVGDELSSPIRPYAGVVRSAAAVALRR